MKLAGDEGEVDNIGDCGNKDEHSLRSQVGIGSESDCLFGQLERILLTSDSEAGVKTEKLGGVAGGEGEEMM